MKCNMPREDKLLSRSTVCRDYSQVINYLERVRAYDDQQIYWNWSMSIQLNLTQLPETCWFFFSRSQEARHIGLPIAAGDQHRSISYLCERSDCT
jgi:hypothetical protein